ncbi:hypothetical protein CSKR_111981 [Clonorchis sinensis]|uniref:Uncharacterized protein n=2 Tax=Clonorchis sinensis TaxID=79923 RepID=A0A8T1MWU5_CLOSI|nr:hypothetical protein CSKR_111981 [Clonorchis sinensis]GAA51192.1 hypothetical protein CLF_105700 [Clonorchis sinensis]
MTACTCQRVTWTVLWLLLLLFIIWPVAFIVSWIYVFVQVFVPCFEPLNSVNEALFAVTSFPLTTREGKSGQAWQTGHELTWIGRSAVHTHPQTHMLIHKCRTGRLQGLDPFFRFNNSTNNLPPDYLIPNYLVPSFGDFGGHRSGDISDPLAELVKSCSRTTIQRTL